MMKTEQLTEAEMEKLDKTADHAGVQYPASAVQDNMKRLQAEGKIDAEGADAIFWLYSYSQLAILLGEERRRIACLES